MGWWSCTFRQLYYVCCPPWRHGIINLSVVQLCLLWFTTTLVGRFYFSPKQQHRSNSTKIAPTWFSNWSKWVNLQILLRRLLTVQIFFFGNRIWNFCFYSACRGFYIVIFTFESGCGRLFIIIRLLYVHWIVQKINYSCRINFFVYLYIESFNPISRENSSVCRYSSTYKYHQSHLSFYQKLKSRGVQ